MSQLGDENYTVTEIMLTSIAESLKRIADHFSNSEIPQRGRHIR